jgi:hypothetical protein
MDVSRLLEELIRRDPRSPLAAERHRPSESISVITLRFSKTS